MMTERRIAERLKKKHNLSANGAHFAWFPDQKAKPFGGFGVVSTPPHFNKEVEEVQSIIKSFRPRRSPSQSAVKALFSRDEWQIDYKFLPEEGLWDFDVYRNGVAVEVLGRHIDEIYKDCFKFLLAYRTKVTEIGVIVVPHRKRSSKSPDAVSVDAILHRFSPVLQDYGLWILRASYVLTKK